MPGSFPANAPDFTTPSQPPPLHHTFPQHALHAEESTSPPAQLSSPTTSPTSTGSSQTPTGSRPKTPKDEKSSNRAKRTIGNHLVSRCGRASLTTTVDSVKLPLTLSPWGDNNPVVLPNVRVRDIMFLGCSHFGGDVIAGFIVDSIGGDWSSHLIKEAMVHFTEKVIKQKVLTPIDKKTLPDDNNVGQISMEEETVLETTSVKTIKVTMKHELMGVNAKISLFEERPCPIMQRGSCAKGWFCPYLYASGRTPHLSRAEDFGIAHCIGPRLEGLHPLLSPHTFPLPAGGRFCRPVYTKISATNGK